MNVIKFQFPKNPITDFIGVQREESFKRRSNLCKAKKGIMMEVPIKPSYEQRKIYFTGLKNHQSSINKGNRSPPNLDELIIDQKNNQMHSIDFLQLIPPSPSFVVRLPKTKIMRRVESDPEILKQQVLPTLQKNKAAILRAQCTHYSNNTSNNRISNMMSTIKYRLGKKQSPLTNWEIFPPMKEKETKLYPEHKSYRQKMYKYFFRSIQNKQKMNGLQDMKKTTPSFTLEKFKINESNNEIEDFFQSYVENQKILE